ncbi:hypothetical protein ACFVU2_01155 [Leifsonia sp. NPDC058194]|uniref:hypothetical protein n=1 Tax=Leifsonia sp. NPDC058194 TaxID=3346374 RepID=UPI0036DA69A4
MTRPQKVAVGVVGALFGAVGLFCLVALAQVLIGIPLLPDGEDAAGSVLLIAAAALAGSAGAICCAAILRWRAEPSQRRASYVDLGTGKHSSAGRP